MEVILYSTLPRQQQHHHVTVCLLFLSFNVEVHIFVRLCSGPNIIHPEYIGYSIHSAAAAPKISFSTSRPLQVQGAKSACQITNRTTQTMAVHPQTSASGPSANRRFKKVSGVAGVCSPLKIKVGRPASIQKPVPICIQGHDMLNVSILASTSTQKMTLAEKLVPLVQSIHPTLEKSLEYFWRWIMLKFFICSNILSFYMPKLMNSSLLCNPTKLKILS